MSPGHLFLLKAHVSLLCSCDRISSDRWVEFFKANVDIYWQQFLTELSHDTWNRLRPDSLRILFLPTLHHEQALEDGSAGGDLDNSLGLRDSLKYT